MNKRKKCSSSTKQEILILKPMPETALIDPITGKLPKNYKEILAKNNGTLPKRPCHNTIFSNNIGSGQKTATGRDRRRSKSLTFNVSPLQMNENLLTVGQTHDNNYRKSPFVNPGQSSRIPKSDLPNRTKTHNAKVDESLLLDIEESERGLFMPKKKQKIFLVNVPQPQKTPVHKTQKSSKKRSTSSSSSLEEFLKLEQQFKTPRNLNKRQSKLESNLSEIIDNIMKKFNENIVLYEKINSEIVANNIEINKSLKQIVKYLEEVRKNSTTIINSIDAGQPKEDIFRIQNISPNTQYRCGEIGLIHNLRVAPLQKYLDAIGNSVHTPSEKNYLLTSKSTSSPNTMLRSVFKRASEELLKLQDTPKSTL